jgi:integrase
VQDGEVTIPPEVSKNGREHTFPIGALAAKLLEEVTADTALLFPARGTTDHALNGWSKSKKALDRKLAGSVAPWQLRDLRRTYRTIHARIKTPPHIAERIINHVSSAPELRRICDRYEYMDEMRAAVERYEAFFHSLVSRPRDAAPVVTVKVVAAA